MRAISGHSGHNYDNQRLSAAVHLRGVFTRPNSKRRARQQSEVSPMENEAVVMP
jgi:hypothetical protein